MKKKNRRDYVECLAEELKMNGFDVSVLKNSYKFTIEMDTHAGKLSYEPMYDILMKDYYRFIMIYGNKLFNWALQRRNCY